MKRQFTSIALALAVAGSGSAIGAAASEPSAFSVEENARLYAVRAAGTENERLASRRALARFYSDKELHVEALAALAAADDDEARLLRARAEVALLRNDAALVTLADERIAGDAAAAALRAIALARLGAYEAAGVQFARADPPSLQSLALEFQLLKGETALALDDIAGARAALGAAEEIAGRGAAASEFLSVSIAAAAGEAGARARFRNLAKSAPPRLAALAGLRLLAMDLHAGAISANRARADLATLGLKWRGGVFEREWLQAAVTAEKDAIGRIEALRRLALDHPQSDAAVAAKSDLQAALGAILNDEKRDAREVARLFYDSVEFAPRGAEGDAMVRALADRLVRLDLLKEAAELLDHQVFKRLRGPQRSVVAADLAQIHLDDRRPAEALRVLRATRVAGIDAETLERRRILEATALERTGAAGAALDLLSGSAGSALDLRADIAWRAELWPEAAASYRALIADAAGPLTVEQREALLRAGAAYVLAGDTVSFEAFRVETAERFGAFPEQDLLALMSLEDAGSGAKFLDAYRRLYAAKG